MSLSGLNSRCRSAPAQQHIILPDQVACKDTAVGRKEGSVLQEDLAALGWMAADLEMKPYRDELYHPVIVPDPASIN